MRLWPLSNARRSKQFLKVLRDADGRRVSMVQRVWGQIARVPLAKDVTIATSEGQRDAIERQLPAGARLVLEPERRDTAPAIMLACESLALEQGAAAGDTVVVLPIDTYADQPFYDSIGELDAAVQADVASLLLLGVCPTYPSEKYGYVVPATTQGPAPWPVARFVEKPDAVRAAGLVAQGALWSCGVFAFRLGWLLDLTHGYLDAPAFEDYRVRYAELPKNSFDYEVVERASSVAVMPYAGVWKDLGTWNTLTEEMAEPYEGDVVVDEDTVRGVSVINETDLPLVVAGVSDAVVVATPDGILVSGKEASAHIKDEVRRARAARPRCEGTSWGGYRVLLSEEGPDGTETLTRELSLDAGARVDFRRRGSLAALAVASGTGVVELAGTARAVGPGSAVEVGAGACCTLRADTDMRVVEVLPGLRDGAGSPDADGGAADHVAPGAAGATARLAGDVARSAAARGSAPVATGGLPVGGGEAHPWRVPFLNAHVDAVDLGQVCSVVARHVRTREPGYMVSLNTDIAIRLEGDPEFREAHRDASLVLMDSQPLLDMARRQGLPVREKISGSDLMTIACGWAAEEGWSVFVLGGRPGVPELAALNLVAAHPGLRVAGTLSPAPGFERDAEATAQVVSAVSDAAPDLLFCCLGAPKSEKFVHGHLAGLGVPFTFVVGTAVDFEAGTVRRAPRWMSDHGLEWLWRFSREPRRLFRRYFVDSWQLLDIVRRHGGTCGGRHGGGSAP